jgi:hypothetical protein
MKYFLLIFSLLLPFSSKAGIDQIPKAGLVEIKSLFDYLCCEHDFSYVIFGSKPMALADICLETTDVPVHRQFRAQMLIIQTKERLNAWYKYKNELKLNDFILLDKEEDLFDCLVFILIHKAHMLSLLQSHEVIFKEILGDSFSPKTFLDKIEKRNISLAQAIHNHYGLLGIMLGYGVRNSMLFQERLTILKELAKCKHLLSKDNELEKRFRKLDAQFQDFSEFEEFPLLRPLYFGADLSHPETIALKSRYKQDRQKIEELMKKPHFMDRVLKRLGD